MGQSNTNHFLLGDSWLEIFTCKKRDQGLSQGETTLLAEQWVKSVQKYIKWLRLEGFSQKEVEKIINETVDRCKFDLSKFPKRPPLHKVPHSEIVARECQIRCGDLPDVENVYSKAR